MLQSVQNNVFVKVDHKYIGNISNLMRIASIQNGASVDPSQFVNIMGTVVSIPKSISGKREDNGFTTENIKIGDTAIFSYIVIYDLIMEEEDADPIYKNRVWLDAKELFAVDIKNLFAVIRDGEIIMLNGYVMTTDFEESKIIIPAHMRRLKKSAKCEVISIGEPKQGEPKLDISRGDEVYFNPLIAQKYQISGKKFCIITQKQVFGKKIVG